MDKLPAQKNPVQSVKSRYKEKEEKILKEATVPAPEILLVGAAREHAVIDSPLRNELPTFKASSSSKLRTSADVNKLTDKLEHHTDDLTPQAMKRQLSPLGKHTKSLNQTQSSRQERVSASHINMQRRSGVEKNGKNHRTGSSLSSVKFKNLSSFSQMQGVGFARASNE